MRIQSTSNFLALSLLLTILATSARAQVFTNESVIRATVLHQLLAEEGGDDKDIGVQLSEAQLKSLRAAFGHERNLMTLSVYLRKHPNGETKATCFWIKIDSRTPDAAVVEGGDYPIKISTRWGPMYRYTTDYEFHLMKVKGYWKIVSSKITGES